MGTAARRCKFLRHSITKMRLPSAYPAHGCVRLFRLAEFVSDTHARPLLMAEYFTLVTRRLIRRNLSRAASSSVGLVINSSPLSTDSGQGSWRLRGRLFRQPSGQAASHTANRTVPGSTFVTCVLREPVDARARRDLSIPAPTPPSVYTGRAQQRPLSRQRPGCPRADGDTVAMSSDAHRDTPDD